jgi:hypothetical protein
MIREEEGKLTQTNADDLLEFSTEHPAAQLFKYFKVADVEVIRDAYSIAMGNMAKYSNFLKVYHEVFRILD